MDGERIHAESERKSWAKAHQIVMREGYVGLQYVSRKRHPPSNIVGAWAG